MAAGQTVEFWHAGRYPLWAGAGRQANDTFEGGFRNQDDRPGQGQ